MRTGSLSGRVLVAVAILSLLSATGVIAGSRPAPPGWQPPDGNAWTAASPKYVVMLILDGGVPAYLKLGDFPHIAALAREGTRYSNAWDGILESETPTGHATIGTGSYPRRHGVISFAWANDQGTVSRPTDPLPIEQGQLENLLKRSGVPSIASALKKHDPSARIVVTSGHKDYAVDAVGGWDADYLMYYGFQGQSWVPIAIPRHVPPQPVMTAPGLTAYAPHLATGDQDSLAVHLAMSAFHTLRQRVTIINLPEFDWPLGHLDGGIADKNFAWQLMSRLDADVAFIEAQLKAAHVFNQTLFVLTADHGMASLSHSVSYQAIEKAVQAAGTSWLRYDYHTAGYLWLRDPSKAAAVAAQIMRIGDPRIRAVYYRRPDQGAYTQAAGTRGLVAGVDAAYQYLLGTMAGPTSPQDVVLLADNTSIRGPNQTSWHGDHGGAAWGSQHIPLILAGPGVRRGVLSHYPASLVDVAPTILNLLGASSDGMDGIGLADAMLHASDADLTQQEKRGAQLKPLVAALARQSKSDGP